MIVSASRRTDIPSYYGEWLVNRLREGSVLIPNPYHAGRLGRLTLSPDIVDCIVFWSKNPAPLIDRLPEIDAMGYRYYFQFTLTPYGAALEPGLPPKDDLTRVFLKLARRVGPGRMVWRYDPIIVTPEYTVARHLECFRALCGALQGAACRCVLSFYDPYPHLGNDLRAPSRGEMLALAEGFAGIAAPYRLPLFTCAEEIDLSRFGIGHSACIDGALAANAAGYPLRVRKDPGQRPACGCAESVDIGAYSTCPRGCVYCYATRDEKAAKRRAAAHDPSSPMLTGRPRGDELITDRTGPSLKLTQLSLL